MKWRSKQRGMNPHDPEWIDDYDPVEDYENWAQAQEERDNLRKGK